MSSRRLRILVVDDHALVRAGIIHLLEDEQDIGYMEECTTGARALQGVREDEWDVVTMDISLAEGDSLDILKLMKLEKPMLPVLIVTMHPESQYAMRALRRGACGYLTKDSAPDQLIIAIRKVADGGTYLSASLVWELAGRLQAKPKDTLFDLLTDREFAVLRSIASGKRLTAIASELHLSAKTVTTYRKRLLDKLGLQSNAALARFAIENRLMN